MNKQAKKLIYGYLSWLIKHEQVIRNRDDLDEPYITRNVEHHANYGLCGNIGNFIIDREGSLKYDFRSLNEKWSYFSGNNAYPVPTYLGYVGTYHTAKVIYEEAGPFKTWCRGPYADARWAYIHFLHEELSKCL